MSTDDFRQDDGVGGGWPASENREVFPPGHPALKELPVPASEVTSSQRIAESDRWPRRGYVKDSETTLPPCENLCPGC